MAQCRSVSIQVFRGISRAKPRRDKLLVQMKLWYPTNDKASIFGIGTMKFHTMGYWSGSPRRSNLEEDHNILSTTVVYFCRFSPKER